MKNAKQSDAEEEYIGIVDELTEITKLKAPYIFIAEWIPFDMNMFNDFAEAIQANKYHLPTFLATIKDREPMNPIFTLGRNAEAVRISVLSYNPRDYIEFTSDIIFGKKREITARLGVLIDASGVTIYSTRIIKTPKGEKVSEATEFEEWASVDKLSRIIANIWDESSTAINSLLNDYQRRILNTVYPGYAKPGLERAKVIGVISSEIWVLGKIYTPEKFAEALKNQSIPVDAIIGEFQQIIGWIIKDQIHVFRDSVIIEGDYGIIIICSEKDLSKYALLLKAYLSIKALDKFFAYLYKRIMLMWDRITSIRERISKLYDERRMIEEWMHDIRKRLFELSTDSEIITSVMIPANLAIRRVRKIFNKIQEMIANLSEEDKRKINSVIRRLSLEEIIDEMENMMTCCENIAKSLREDIDGVNSVVDAIMSKYMEEISKAQELLGVVFTFVGAIEGLSIMFGLLFPEMSPQMLDLCVLACSAALAIGTYVFLRYRRGRL